MHRLEVVRGMALITLRVQIGHRQLVGHRKLDSRYRASDFAADKLKSTARTYVVEVNTVAAEHTLHFAVIPRLIKACDLADAVGLRG